MSLNEPTLFNVVLKQFKYKFTSYTGLFSSMMVLQILALFFSLNGIGSFMGGSDTFEVKATTYSADFVIIFMLLWALFTSILITTRPYREDDFTFVTTRVSSHLSNALFLLAASFIAGTSAILSSFLLKIIIFLIGTGHFIAGNAAAGFQGILIGIVATSLYILLFSSLGYIIGTLIQLNRAFAVIIPVLFIGFATFGERAGYGHTAKAIVEFFSTESSFVLFFVKVIVSAVLLFAGSIAIFNRMEVRQ